MNTMDLIRWILSAVLGLYGVFILGFNWISFIHAFLGRARDFPSWVPLFGGIFTALSIAIVPIDGVRRLFWIPLVSDPTILSLALLPFPIARDWLASRQKGD